MSFWGWYIDPIYLMIFVVTFLISIGAQIMVSSAYRKWSAVKNSAVPTNPHTTQAAITTIWAAERPPPPEPATPSPMTMCTMSP